MKQKLLSLLDSALSPFGVRLVKQSYLDQVDHHASLADLYRRVCLQPTEKPATLSPRPKRRGRIPTVELLTTPQVRMVRSHQLSTAALARKLGVSWPTANKLRDELC
jgi:hypothetical protein